MSKASLWSGLRSTRTSAPPEVRWNWMALATSGPFLREKAPRNRVQALGGRKVVPAAYPTGRGWTAVGHEDRGKDHPARHN